MHTKEQREACEAYLKNYFLTVRPVDTPEGYKPTEDDWKRMPREQLDWAIDMVLGFGQVPHPAYAELMQQYKKKTHSDLSFGLIAKQILAKIK